MVNDPSYYKQYGYEFHAIIQKTVF